MKKKTFCFIFACILTATALSPGGATAEDTSLYRHGNGLIAPNAVPVISDTQASGAKTRSRGNDLPTAYGFTIEDGKLTVSGQTPVKNQGSNGTCWAFSAMAAAEANLLLNSAGEGVPNLSEAHMIYSLRQCGASKIDLSNIEQGYEHDPTEGGNYEYAASYLMRGSLLGGMLTEETDPYPSTKIPYRSIDETKLLGESKAYTVENMPIIIGEKAAVYDGNNAAAMREMTAIKQAVRDYGAVSTSAYWFESKAYYRADTGAYYAPGRHDADHAVTIVGWDDDYSTERFSTAPPADGAWLVKNSWGTGDGIGIDGSGYYWVSYCDPVIGELSYAIDGIHAYDARELVHEYDYCIDTFSTNKWSYLVAFPHETDAERINAIRIALNTAATFDISLCTDYTPTGADGIDEQDFTYQQTVSVDKPGFYTIALDEPALITGDYFAVRIDLSSNEAKVYVYEPLAMPVLKSDGDEYDAVFCKGEENGSWRALGYADGDWFVPCIKAVTEDLTGNSFLDITSVERSGNTLAVSVDTDMAKTVLLAAAAYRDGRLERLVTQTTTLHARSERWDLALTADDEAEIAVFALNPQTFAPLTKKWQNP